MTRAARAAYFAIAPCVCLALFWRVLITWFLGDDFAWLGKPLEVQSWGDLPHALFAPEAQGTVRVLSERAFFLVFTPLFGLHALPYRLIVLATWFVDLGLASVIGARLAGSRWAGLFASVLWAASVNRAYPLARVSAYNEILDSLCILLAFYARLRWIESDGRRWQATEWAAYLAGFGAKEMVVMYPAIALLHAILFARKKWRGTLALFVPAALFGAVHYFFIPKPASGVYAIVWDRRLLETFLRYLSVSLGPVGLGGWVAHARRPAMVGVGLIALALAGFAIERLRRREYAVVFFIGWFAILIAPVLPLPNHIFDFYATLPELGLAWLGGWAAAVALRSRPVWRGVAIFLGAAYLAGSALAANGATRWYYEHSQPVRTMVLGIRDAAQQYPGSAFFLAGVDQDLYELGIQDNPFRLFGLTRIYLIPGSENTIHGRADLGGVTRWVSSPQAALHAIQYENARVFRVEPRELLDITHGYETVLLADPRATRIDFVDAGDASYAAQLGPTWYAAEKGSRWMPRSATLRMSGPAQAGARLYVTGYVPPAIVAAGPVTLTFTAAERNIGAGNISTDGNFHFDFLLPDALVGVKEIEIGIEASRVVRPASDPRDFGAVFGTFAIR